MPRRDGDARSLRGRGLSGSTPGAGENLTWSGSIWAPTPDALVRPVSGATAAVAGDFINCDTTAAGFDVTLPTAAGVPGQSVSIRKATSDVHVVTVKTSAGQTINGEATKTLSSQYEVGTYTSDGVNWMIANGSASVGPFLLASSRQDTAYPHNVYTVFAMEPIAIPGATATYRAVVSAPRGYTLYVRLCDFTAGGTVLSELSTSSTTPVTLSGVFTPTDRTRRVYSVEVKVAGSPGVSDIGVLYGSSIEVP